MKQSADEERVAGWLDPVPLAEMLAVLREVGFSGDTYRGCFADLEASLDDDDAGALHFLRYGYAEGRVFRTGLDLTALDRLRQLRASNHFYLRNIFAALVTAWIGTHIRSVADLALHRGRIDRLCAMGGVPVLILGDPSAGLYRRGASAGERWICPLAMAPLAGIDELRRTPPHLLLPSTSHPTIWKFGQSDMQAGYLAHRLRVSIGPNDRAAFLAFAEPAITAYAAVLAEIVPPAVRASHWIAALFPPVWQAERAASAPLLVEEVGADTLLERTAMFAAFNQRLEQAIRPLGFNLLRDFESFLTTYGVVDDRYLVPLRDSSDLDYRATGAILSTSLWSIAAERAAGAPPLSIGDQFTNLLQEIRQVQMTIE